MLEIKWLLNRLLVSLGNFLFLNIKVIYNRLTIVGSLCNFYKYLKMTPDPCKVSFCIIFTEMVSEYLQLPPQMITLSWVSWVFF
jgi:hypothetical protein